MKNKTKFNIRKFITNDKYLFCLSLILAILVWTFTSINVSVDQERTIKVNVPVKLNTQIADNIGMQFYSDNETIEMNVKITGAKYIVGQVTQDDLKINFDTSSISKTGEQSIPIIVSSANDSLQFNVEEFYPNHIKGYFDVGDFTTLDVKVNYNKDFVPDGYTVGNPVLTDEEVMVYGPKTYVEKIKGAQVNISVPTDEKLTEQFKGTFPIEIVGEDIQTQYLTIKSKTNDSVIDKVGVTLPVLKTCELPVGVKFEGIPESLDPNAISVTCNPSKINAGILESADISEAIAGVINFSEIPAGGKTFSFETSLINGVTVIDDIKTIEVVVGVDPNYIEKDVNIAAKDIEFVGVPDGYRVAIDSLSSDTVSVITRTENASSIKSSSLSMKCDLSKSSSNDVYTIDVTVNDKGSWVYSSYTVTARLVEIN